MVRGGEVIPGSGFFRGPDFKLCYPSKLEKELKSAKSHLIDSRTGPGLALYGPALSQLFLMSVASFLIYEFFTLTTLTVCVFTKSTPMSESTPMFAFYF